MSNTKSAESTLSESILTAGIGSADFAAAGGAVFVGSHGHGGYPYGIRRWRSRCVQRELVDSLNI